VSQTIGIHVGGSLLRVDVKNFPVVAASEKQSPDVSAIFDSNNIGRVYVKSSTKLETNFLVESPAIDLMGQTSRTMEVKLYPIRNPLTFVTLSFLVKEADPNIMGSILPSKGAMIGGVRITVRIQYFPFPSDILIRFGETDVPASSISFDPTSTKLLSTVLFFTPRILSKSCMS
jgi:hypothetical protein